MTEPETDPGAEPVAEPVAEPIAEPASEPASETIALLDDEADGPRVRRKIAVFRRLEPMDERRAGTYLLPESPYLEAAVVELTVPKKTHGELVALAAKRRATLAPAARFIASYDPAGWLFAAGGGGLVGVWLDYLPHALFWPLLVCTILGVVVGFATRTVRTRSEARAAAAWEQSPERGEHDRLAAALAKGWARASAELLRERGYHTVIRVAEGAVEPLRLASIDPRPMESEPAYFDPDDLLPSEAAGLVRYEQVRASGEVITRAIEGTSDFREESP